MGRLTLTLIRNGTEVCSSEPLTLRSDLSRWESTSASGDYLALLWTAVSVVVLGQSAAVVLDTNSGNVVKSFRLEFTGKPSLERVGLSSAGENSLLLVASTKRLWLIDRDLQTVLRYEPSLHARWPAKCARFKLDNCM